MSAPTLNWSVLNPTGVPQKKKRVLLVDTSRTKRDLRSETMRKLGVEVDCAADITEARCWWRPGPELPAQEDDQPALWSDVKAALAANPLEGPAQRWGILEACRRISAVRSVSEARSRALRNRPAPARDSEISSRRLDEAEVPGLGQSIMEKAQ
jgi:CheY-like chemotaxis protein